MPSQYVLASQVSPIHTRRAIRVRLVRSYEVPELRRRAISKSKECLFHDEEGTYIHGTISREDVVKYRTVFVKGKDETVGDEVNSLNNIVQARKQEGEQELSPLSKRSLLVQFSST
nr:protein FAR1-RELATED SEQUENCE 5-like [Ipomoea batatas]